MGLVGSGVLMLLEVGGDGGFGDGLIVAVRLQGVSLSMGRTRVGGLEDEEKGPDGRCGRNGITHGKRRVRGWRVVEVTSICSLLMLDERSESSFKFEYVSIGFDSIA